MNDQKIHEALEVFSSLHRDYPEDTVIRLHMTRCEKYIKQGFPDDWTGVETL
ncbi:MAG: hypothetical protein WA126_05940 [Thermodesulfovibrionales bacterium]